MRPAQITIRKAERQDAECIRVMQELSFSILGAANYSPAQIAAYVAKIGTFDPAVIHEGHYFVAVDRCGEILGTGGWSRLAPRYGGLPPATDPAKALIRSVFVAASAARCGIGSAIMGHAEADAAAHGVELLSLTATLSGVPLYNALGYRPTSRRDIVLGDQRMPFVEMQKPIAGEAAAA
jgi:GNAT superfamily N-acetyltransferase